MARTVILAGTLVVVGIVLTGLSAVQLGVARAAAKWPSARAPRVGRGPAVAGIAVGAAALGAAGGLAASLSPADGWLWTAAVVAAGALAAGLSVVVAARLASQVELKALISTPSPAYVAIAPRAEPVGLPAIAARSDSAPLSQPATVPASRASSAPLIGDGVHNTSPDGYGAGDEPDLSVPADAEPGWVYKDADGVFLLVVELDAGRGRRLVRLEDFTLAGLGEVRRPLSLTGSIEIQVWPLD
ncbi:hypothetical protein Afil01_19830 [Actinorhabdospora filicis]|uniref:Uncharacterized protein n=1 Tax=Actinorhabdospora filicis TaxID=1785913 RepID=A0A9W6SK57_9ACTN|nr:hypothetical protein [Actinorhabdospora filicis]GLZ77176.1 hypothetical protein Afil01_19830 [Actinorhabdospora filicis]